MKAFLRRPGGVDQYPQVRVEWKLHQRPQLYAYDSTGKAIGKPHDLSHLSHDGLHDFFSKHYTRDSTVTPPSAATRMYRRIFGWAYGISTAEAAMLFVCGGAVLAIAIYALCWRYTALCDSIQDL